MGAKQITGGSALAAVKKLNGARFKIPSAPMVETKAMGRGTMAATISL
jgi:hypothetical protein